MLHFLLVANGRSSVTIATGLAAIEIAGSMDADAVRALGAAPDPSTARGADAVRAQLARARERMLRDMPPWFEANPRYGAARLGVVVPGPGEGGARLLITTDREGENTPYVFGGSPMPELRWTAMSFDNQVVRDARGPHLGGRAPIRDVQGNSVGLVLVETDARYLDSENQLILIAAVVAFLCTLIIAFATSGITAMWLVRPLKSLTGAMAQVAAGDLGTTVPPTRRGDEFDALSDRFNDMVHGLREREKMRRDLSTAREVQNHLLPRRAPVIPGYEVEHSVHYCEQTGGDYVDVFPMPGVPESWGLTVADVSGHGIPAAMLMSWTRAMVRAQAAVHAEDISAMLREINTHLARDAGGSAFLTMFFASLDTGGHRLRWSSAGHDPAVLLRSGGGVVHLSATDVPLGVVEDAPLPVGGDVLLAPGDLLLVSSDGLAQSRDPGGEYFGVGRIEEVLRTHMDRPLHIVRDELLRRAGVHRGGGVQDDDITLLLVRRER